MRKGKKSELQKNKKREEIIKGNRTKAEIVNEVDDEREEERRREEKKRRRERRRYEERKHKSPCRS